MLGSNLSGYICKTLSPLWDLLFEPTNLSFGRNTTTITLQIVLDQNAGSMQSHQSAPT